MTKPQKRFIVYTAAFLLLAVVLANQSRRWFFADPLEITGRPVTRILGKDELHFTLKGKCQSWLVFQPEVTLELRSSAGVHKLVLVQHMWATNSPLVFKLPVPYSEVNSCVLKGTFSFIALPKPNPNGKYSRHDGTRFDAAPVYGYKIDSRWTTK